MNKNQTIAVKVLFKNLIKSIPDLVKEFKEFGIDEVFVLEDLFTDPQFQKEIKNTDIKTWVIIQTFLNIEREDSLYAIQADGTKAIGAGNGSWLHMICPNGGPIIKERFLQNLIRRLKDIIIRYNPSGINLDFIRYFVFWEDVYENNNPDALPQTCFCDRCLSLFSSKHGIRIPKAFIKTSEISKFILKNHLDDWVEFKTDTITNTVKKIVDSIKIIKPDIQFNIHAVPWKSGEFNGAIRRIAGQDFTALGKIIDGISPMCYTGMLKRNAGWINEVVNDIALQTDIKILPAFQGVSMYGSQEIDNKSFKQFIKESLRSPSSGVAFWPWEQITDEHKKIIRELTAS